MTAGRRTYGVTVRGFRRRHGGGWRGRSRIGQVDLYTRVSLYCLAWIVVFYAVFPLVGDFPAGTAHRVGADGSGRGRAGPEADRGTAPGTARGADPRPGSGPGPGTAQGTGTGTVVPRCS